MIIRSVQVQNRVIYHNVYGIAYYIIAINCNKLPEYAYYISFSMFIYFWDIL